MNKCCRIIQFEILNEKWIQIQGFQKLIIRELIQFVIKFKIESAITGKEAKLARPRAIHCRLLTADCWTAAEAPPKSYCFDTVDFWRLKFSDCLGKGTFCKTGYNPRIWVTAMECLLNFWLDKLSHDADDWG